MRTLGGLFLQLFCVADLETGNDLMPAAGELMMSSRLLIMPGACSVDHWVRFLLARSEAQGCVSKGVI